EMRHLRSLQRAASQIPGDTYHKEPKMTVAAAPVVNAQESDLQTLRKQLHQTVAQKAATDAAAKSLQDQVKATETATREVDQTIKTFDQPAYDTLDRMKTKANADLVPLETNAKALPNKSDIDQLATKWN